MRTVGAPPSWRPGGSFSSCPNSAASPDTRLPSRRQCPDTRFQSVRTHTHTQTQTPACHVTPSLGSCALRVLTPTAPPNPHDTRCGEAVARMSRADASRQRMLAAVHGELRVLCRLGTVPGHRSQPPCTPVGQCVRRLGLVARGSDDPCDCARACMLTRDGCPNPRWPPS